MLSLTDVMLLGLSKLIPTKNVDPEEADVPDAVVTVVPDAVEPPTEIPISA